MTTTQNTQARNVSADQLFKMLAGKVLQAMANGATEVEAIAAVRQLVLDTLGKEI